MLNLECQIAQETRLIMENPQDWKKWKQAKIMEKIMVEMKAMESRRAKEVRAILNAETENTSN